VCKCKKKNKKENNMKKNLFLLGFLLFLFAGCSTGFHQDRVSQLLNQSTLLNNYSDSIPESLGKVAVWMNIETLNNRGELESIWKWNKKDVELVGSYLDSMKKDKRISEYYFLKTSLLEEKSINGIIAKTSDNTNTVIVIKTIVELDKYFNPAALLDLTIIGAYWIPGSNRDAYAKTRIEVIDLDSKRIISHFDGEGCDKISKPSFLIDSEEAVSKAKLDSLRNALRAFYKKFSNKTNLNL